MNELLNLEKKRKGVTKALKDVTKGGIPWHQGCFSDGSVFFRSSIKMFVSSLMVDID